MARLYSNENFPLPAVEELRGLGHDVLTVQETGKAGQSVPDEDILAFAASEDRTLLALNRRHFVRLHRDRPEHSGRVVCTFDPDYAALARRIHEAIEAQDHLANRLIRINRP